MTAASTAFGAHARANAKARCSARISRPRATLHAPGRVMRARPKIKSPRRWQATAAQEGDGNAQRADLHFPTETSVTAECMYLRKVRAEAYAHVHFTPASTPAARICCERFADGGAGRYYQMMAAAPATGPGARWRGAMPVPVKARFLIPGAIYQRFSCRRGALEHWRALLDYRRRIFAKR